MKKVKAIIWIRRLIRKFLTINTSHSATGKVATELVFHTNVMLRIYEKVQILEENKFDWGRESDRTSSRKTKEKLDIRNKTSEKEVSPEISC